MKKEFLTNNMSTVVTKPIVDIFSSSLDISIKDVYQKSMTDFEVGKVSNKAILLKVVHLAKNICTASTT